MTRSTGCRFLAALLALTTAGTVVAQAGPSPLLAIDQNRSTVVERIVREWGPALAQSSAGLSADALRSMLEGARADQLLAASLAGSLTGLRDVLANSLASDGATRMRTKVFGDSADDVVYTPVTPCRLIDTLGTFAAVYQGGGAFTGGQVRTYALQGGNGVCLTQLPSGLHPSAVQLQVFGIPLNPSASGDIEILPQGSTFGATSTEVYVGNVLINTASTTARINVANNQIAIQVRGGGAHLAVDVVRYFKAPGGQYFMQGGNAVGAPAVLGTSDNQPLDIRVNGARAMRFEPRPLGPNIVGGNPDNHIDPAHSQQTIAGGGGSVGFTCGTNGVLVPCPNQTSDDGAAVGGGAGNVASGLFSTVPGGVANTASGVTSTVGGGEANAAAGFGSTVPGGRLNTASGELSFAAGHHAKATTKGSFIWADSQDFDFQPSVNDFFGVRATGGVGFTVAINPATGAVTQFCNLLPATPSWQCTSDRDAKENYVAADGQDILRRLVSMPLYSWSFKGADPSIRSLGPTAQDFYAAFGLGQDNRMIANLNLEGVALAAIQGLYRELIEKGREIERLQGTIAEIEHLRRRLDDLESARESR